MAELARQAVPGGDLGLGEVVLEAARPLRGVSGAGGGAVRSLYGKGYGSQLWYSTDLLWLN